MLKTIICILLTLALSACDSEGLDTTGDDTAREEIESVHWLPGDSLLLALVGIPNGTRNDRDLYIRIYDLNGNTREQFQVSFDPYTAGHELHLTSDGSLALFNEFGDLAWVNLSTHAKTVVSPGTDAISFAPDANTCVLFRRSDNMNFGDGVDTFALTTITTDGITIDTLFPINQGFSTFRDFPLLLTNNRIATLETDSAFSTKMFIRDLQLQEQRVFHLPMFFFMTYTAVVKDCPDFFFISSDVTGYKVNRFRTDIGFIDPLHELRNSVTYEVLECGGKIIYWETGAKRCAVVDVASGVITPILGSEGAEAVFRSNDGKQLAVVRADAKLSVITLP